jgi:light-regulated signal transduction histidine kinase (bacteriophytochrome)/CheY-like chemotaxis protein
MDHNKGTIERPDENFDLTTCDKEPIHILGRVQSFAALLAISPDWIVNHASKNLDKFIGISAEDALGVPVDQILNANSIHEIRTRLQLLNGPDSIERLFGLKLTDSSQLFDVAVHLSGRYFILELEKHTNIDTNRVDHSSYVKPMIERIGNAETTDQLCGVAARQLRALIGFDRVMVYKFDEMGSGSVIAESLNGQRESFLGLRYPASDIPKQARALYTRSLLRIIADVSDEGIKIIPTLNPEGQPLDLSLSASRAVSPIHLEYLKNMGVGASMSISILKRGELWGLFACHNDIPKTLSYTIRSAAELFGQLFAFILDQQESDIERAEHVKAQGLHDTLMSQLADGVSIFENLDAILGNIKTVIPFDGAIGWIDGNFKAVGQTPTKEEFKGVVKFLNTTEVSRIFATKNLSSIYPDGEKFSDRTAGILVLPVSRKPRDYIVLCRQEVASMVNWAGNPNKPVKVGAHGARLTPRSSFAVWQEVVRNSCVAWTSGERRAAEALRITLLEVILRLSDASLKERAKAQKSQELLIAELNHRVRNILNLIKGLINQSKDDATTVAEFTNIVGGRVHALALAHDQITKENWSPASARELIQTEAAAYLDGKKDQINIFGPDAMLTPPAFTTLSLVVHELMTNSMKYGALIDSRGTVDVTMARNKDAGVDIFWREKGGPPIQKTPTRKGFGTTIIERSIPFELKGTSDVSYKFTGLEAQFSIPASFVSEFKQDFPMKDDMPVENPQTPAVTPQLSGHVLVVEDNIIIAMDAEDMMGSLGADSVTVTSNVMSALDAIANTTFSFALLDVNLGVETSEPIAALLVESGIPFAFATGYGDAAEITKRFENAPVVQKPYEKSSIENALGSLNLGS